MGGIRERRMPPIPIMPKSLPQDSCREQGSMIQGTGGDSSTGIGFLSIGNGVITMTFSDVVSLSNTKPW